MKSSRIISVVIAVVGVLWVGSGVWAPNEPREDNVQLNVVETKNKQPMQVRVRNIIAEDFKDTVIVTGRIQASRRVDLAAEVSAQVVEIITDKGRFATEGEILAKLEIKDRAARLKEANLRLKQRQIEYNAAQNLSSKGFNSKVSFAKANANLEEAKALVAAAQNDLIKTKITAPIDGVVDQRMIEVGGYVNVGDTLFRIVDLDPLEVVGFVSEHEVKDIHLGKKAVATLLNGQKIEGTVSFISAEADEKTRTFRVEVSLPNPDFLIKAGFTTQLTIDSKIRKAHRISPSALVLNDVGQIGVKVSDGNDTVRFYSVSILKDTSEGMWVDGLPEKSRLITVGQHFVLEGQKVMPVPVERGDGLL